MNAHRFSSSLPLPLAHRAPSVDIVGILRASPIFRDYQQAFQTATGLPLALRSAGSFGAPLEGARNIAPFCALMAARSRSCAACLRTQQQIETAAATGAATMECFAGLNDSAVALRLGEQIVGYLQTGQVMFRAPSPRRFLAAAKTLAEFGLTDADMVQLRAAYLETRVLSRTHYDAVLRLLASFASHLSLVANGLALQQAAAEPPAVARARAFIAERLGEEISLRDVAAVAHMSTFYFCKIFKAATGLTLTDYIARARIERVKELLLNPHTRVSEAAFAAGFQSLSQFNRVFHRVTGESPSAHRLRTRGRVPTPLRPAA
jgi:AraC-like DNA-binding protein/ligand-binding sensor protein